MSKKNDILSLYGSFLKLTNQSNKGLGIFKVISCENSFMGTATLDKSCTFLKQAIVNYKLNADAKLTFYTKLNLVLSISYKPAIKEYAQTKKIKTILSLCHPENKLSLLCQTHTMKLDRPTSSTLSFRTGKNNERISLYPFLVK
jgi:hypothetical protein